jgi:membrane associated rhomboid family serine protease
MIPVGDVIPTRTTPWITILLIALSALVFVYELTLSEQSLRLFSETSGLVPAHFSWVRVVSAMFVHSGWLHVGSNVFALWVFGSTIEDRMGHGRYLIFYMLAGVVGSLVQTAANPSSPLPIGATGAIAGVLGAYVVLFLHSRVLVLIPLPIVFDMIEVPALVFLGLWVVFQIAGGAALWGLGGGFLIGLAGVFLFRRRARERVEWWAQ